MMKIIWKFLGKKFLLGGVVSVYSRLKGYKTQTAVVVGVLSYIAQWTGYISPDVGEAIRGPLVGVGGVSLLSKLARYDKEYRISELTPEVIEEAKKIVAEKEAEKAAAEYGVE